LDQVTAGLICFRELGDWSLNLRGFNSSRNLNMDYGYVFLARRATELGQTIQNNAPDEAEDESRVLATKLAKKQRS
jgi:hypothetical protein